METFWQNVSITPSVKCNSTFKLRLVLQVYQPFTPFSLFCYLIFPFKVWKSTFYVASFTYMCLVMRIRPYKPWFPSDRDCKCSVNVSKLWSQLWSDHYTCINQINNCTTTWIESVRRQHHSTFSTNHHKDDDAHHHHHNHGSLFTRRRRLGLETQSRRCVFQVSPVLLH
jgi:hypothetical protein